jgi:hypothetical protein
VAYTRAQVRTQVLQNADAVGSERWDSATAGAQGETDQKIGRAYDRWWARILAVNPRYRYAKRTPTTSAAGLIALSDLSSGSGDSAERYYRVLGVVIAQRRYEFTDAPAQHEQAHAIDSGTGPYVWWRGGDSLYTLPAVASTVVTGVWVNHRPTAVHQLSADSVDVTFPDGYEDVANWEAAADLLMKGAEETGASIECRAMAQALGADLLADVQRDAAGPIRVQYGDDGSAWGSR